MFVFSNHLKTVILPLQIHVSQCGISDLLIGQCRTFCLLSLMLIVGDIISVPVSNNQQKAYMTERLCPNSLIHCSDSNKTPDMTHTKPSSVCCMYDRYITSLNWQGFPLRWSFNAFQWLDSSESIHQRCI